MSNQKLESDKDKYFELIKEISINSNIEISNVKKYYQFAVSVVGIVVAVGLYFSYSSFRDFKTDLKNDGEKIQKQVRDDIELFKNKLINEVKLEVDNVRNSIKDKINIEFENDKINKLINDIAYKRTEDVADEIIKKEIDSKVLPLKNEFQKLIEDNNLIIKSNLYEIEKSIETSNTSQENLNLTLSDAKKALEQLNNQNKFLTNIILAYSGSRKAFEFLEQLSKEGDNPLNLAALQQIFYIKKMYTSNFGNLKPKRIDYSEPDGKGGWIKKKIMSKKQVLDMWESFPSGVFNYGLAAIVEEVHENDIFTNNEKSDFFYKVIVDSKGSLDAAHLAAIYLSQQLNIKYESPFDFNAIKEHFEKINNEKVK